MKLYVLFIAVAGFLNLMTGSLHSQQPEIFVQLGHSDRINQIGFSPDGRYLLSVSEDKSLRIWDAETYREIRDLQGHTSGVLSFAFTPDGKYAVSGGYEKQLFIWDIPNGRLEKTIDLPDPVPYASAVAVSPDGKYVVIGTSIEYPNINQLAVYRFQDGTFNGFITGYQDIIRTVKFSSDGKWIAAAGGGWENFEGDKSKDNTIRIWDFTTRKEIRTLTGHRTYVSQIAFSSDGKKIFSAGSDSTIRIWNVQTGNAEKVIKGNSGFRDVAVTPDGRFLIGAGEQDQILVWDMRLNKDVTPVRNEEYFDGFSSVAVSADGKKIALSKSHFITVRDHQMNIVATLGGNVVIPEQVFYLPGDRLTILGRSGMVANYDRLTGRLVNYVKYEDYNSQYYFSNNKIIDKRDENTVIDKGQDIPYGLTISPGGVFGIDATEKKIYRFPDCTTSTPIEGNIKPYTHEIAFSQDGNYFAASSNDDETEFSVWDIRTGRKMRSFSGHKSMIKEIVFTREGRHIVSASLDRTLIIWNALTGAPLRTLEGHDEPVYAVDVSRDGKYLLSGSWDQTVKLWDFTSGQCLKTMYGHQNWVTSVAFSEDNATALSGSYDGTVRLWDLNTSNELARFVHFTDGEWIVITPAGYYMSSVNGDRYLNVRIGNKVYGIDQYRSAFYKPGIAENAIKSGLSVTIKESSGGTDLKYSEPPFIVIKNLEDGITLSTTSTELSVYVEDRNQTLKKITVYINGRTAATAETRGMKAMQGMIEIPDGKKSMDVKTSVVLDPGENIIQVVASNGFSEGRKSIRVIAKDEAASVKTDLILPNLWVLAVGVNDYRDKNFRSLSYAAADAAGIAGVFRSQKGKLYKEVNTLVISDQTDVKPTYENIIDNLHYLKKAGANDVAVLFIAGHGLNDESGEFYFLPNDAAMTDDGSIKRSRAISWREIRSILDFPGKKIVLVDACHSEGVSGKKTRSVDTHRFVKELQDANAVIFTSSRGNQLSQESKDWGHGAFTYAIIQGLQGKANLIKDNKISMKELDTYVSETVPLLTNGAQHPITSTPDGYVNFPVAIIE